MLGVVQDYLHFLKEMESFIYESERRVKEFDMSHV